MTWITLDLQITFRTADIIRLLSLLSHGFYILIYSISSGHLKSMFLPSIVS